MDPTMFCVHNPKPWFYLEVETLLFVKKIAATGLIETKIGKQRYNSNNSFHLNLLDIIEHSNMGKINSTIQVKILPLY